MLFVCPPKFCIRIAFIFSWDHWKSQEKLETMLMQNLGGQTKSIMVFSEVAYSVHFLQTEDLKNGDYGVQTRVIFMQNIQFFHYQFLRAAEAFVRLLQSIDWSRITLPQSTSSDWLIRIWLNTEWRFAKINTNAPFAAGKNRVISLKSFIWESSRLLITVKTDFPKSNVSVVHSDWLQLVLFRIRTCFLWRLVAWSSLSSMRRTSVLAKARKENDTKSRDEKSA